MLPRLAWIATLLGLIVGVAAPSAGADHEADPLAVPLMVDQRPDVTQTMYAERRSVAFVVLDCAPGQPLWTEASNAASTWNIDAPVELRVRRASSGCEGSPANRTNEIYFGAADTQAPEVGDYQYAVADGRIQAEDLRLSMREVVERARALNTSTQIVIFNQLMNAFGHVLGLGDAHRQHPDDCNWSVMLGNCRIQRAMPTEADRAALAHLHDTTPTSDRRADLSRFDANDNGRIDDPEFQDALRLWIRGRVTDELFLELLQAWNRGERIGGASRARPAEPSGPFAIRIFDLNGRLVAERGCFPGRHGRETARRAQRVLNARSDLPAGSYLARIRACDTGHATHRLLAKMP